jgi:hypothetical protein
MRGWRCSEYGLGLVPCVGVKDRCICESRADLRHEYSEDEEEGAYLVDDVDVLE